MEIADKVLHAKWIITCEENIPPLQKGGSTGDVLENHSLVIKNGLIEAILPTDTVAKKYQCNNHVDLTNHVLLPGFNNSHTHLAMNYFRGMADDTSLMNWLNHYIWPSEKKWVSEEFVKDASLFAMAEMIRSGTTSFNDMYFFLEATAEAAKTSGMRANIGMTILEFPTQWAQTTDEYFAKGVAFYEKYKNQDLINVTIAPHAPYTISDVTFQRIKELSENLNLKINLHLQETLDEITQSLKAYNVRPIKRLDKLGLINERLIAIHMANLNDEDLNIIAHRGLSVAHCPESNMKLASGTCPAAKLDSLGINVALGTDGAASNNDLDMIGEMRTATFLSKLTTHDPISLPANKMLQMATLNGAKAVGLEKITGSLKKGKSADCIAIDLNQIETLPPYHPASQIVYAASRNQVTHAWVAGKMLMENRQLLTLDEQQIIDKAHYWFKKIGVPDRS